MVSCEEHEDDINAKHNLGHNFERVKPYVLVQFQVKCDGNWHYEAVFDGKQKGERVPSLLPFILVRNCPFFLCRLLLITLAKIESVPIIHWYRLPFRP